MLAAEVGGSVSSHLADGALKGGCYKMPCFIVNFYKTLDKTKHTLLTAVGHWLQKWTDLDVFR